MNNTKASLMAAAAIGMMASIGGVPVGQTTLEAKSTTETNQVQKNTGQGASLQRMIQAILAGRLGGSGRINYRKGPGWTHAQVQRMAKKHRNKVRNRLAHR